MSHWDLGRFELYSVNPPLVRTLAAAPVHFFGDAPLDYDYYDSDPAARSEVLLGRRLIQELGPRSLRYFFWARLAVLPFALMGGLLCYLLAGKFGGSRCGLAALAIWTFSPNVIAYGSLITTDLPSCVALLACCYLFWRWIERPDGAGTGLLGLSLLIAMLIKSVWLILPPIFILLYVVVHWWNGFVRNGVAWNEASFGHSLGRLVLACLIGLLGVNAFYGFKGSFRPLDQHAFVSAKLGQVGGLQARLKSLPEGECCGITTHSNRFKGTLLGSLPVPLPENYVAGIDIQTRDFERGWYDENWRSYLLGQWKLGGWWYYYVLALLVKVPLATWCLAGLGWLAICLLPNWPAQRLGWACLGVPTITLLILVSSSIGLNRYFRYALPVLPALIILGSQVGRLFANEGPGGLKVRPMRWASIVCGVWLVGTTAFHAPHHLSYFNELAGGPQRGGDWLCDSNLDWGQDLLLLQDWLEDHPEAKSNLHLAYFGSFDPKDIGIEYSVAPPMIGPRDTSPAGLTWTGPIPGWHVVSRNLIKGHPMPLPEAGRSLRFRSFGPNAYQYFNALPAVANVGHSLKIVHLDLDDANRVREAYHLEPLRRIGEPSSDRGLLDLSGEIENDGSSVARRPQVDIPPVLPKGGSTNKQFTMTDIRDTKVLSAH